MNSSLSLFLAAASFVIIHTPAISFGWGFVCGEGFDGGGEEVDGVALMLAAGFDEAATGFTLGAEREFAPDDCVLVQRELEFRPVAVSEWEEALCRGKCGVVPHRFCALVLM